MANLKTWLTDAEAKYGETIESVVVGKHYRGQYTDSAQPDENVPIDRSAALAKVDQEFDDGYGGADCFPLYAWTESWVFFVHEYDGATGLNAIPRRAINCAPEFGGECA